MWTIPPIAAYAQSGAPSDPARGHENALAAAYAWVQTSPPVRLHPSAGQLSIQPAVKVIDEDLGPARAQLR